MYLLLNIMSDIDRYIECNTMVPKFSGSAPYKICSPIKLETENQNFLQLVMSS